MSDALNPLPSAEKDARLRAIAQAADNGGRPWEWSGGYPQQVVRQGDAMLVAETYEGPDFPSTIAEFIATFDPPTVLALLDALRATRRVARDAVASKEAMGSSRRRWWHRLRPQPVRVIAVQGPTNRHKWPDRTRVLPPGGPDA